MILFTGRGTSGSWQVRGVQLGSAIGQVKPRASVADLRAADLVVVVKRPARGQIEALQRCGRPWVWDVVDFYPQPECAQWSAPRSIHWVKEQIHMADPTAVVWPNARMAQDCGDGRPERVLYHHYRPGLRPRTPVESPVVGYEGSPRYLGRWGAALATACARRGWTFRTTGTPQSFDIAVAFRDRPANGYAQRHWKSNVKLANCHATGTAFLGAPEAGYRETAAGGEVWCRHIGELDACLNALSPITVRQALSARFQQRAYSLQSAARDLRSFLGAIA